MVFLDAYTVRARLFPAVLAIAPAIALFLLAGRLTYPGFPEVITALAIAVLFFAASDLARRMGKRKERELFASTGGRPENQELSYLDDTLDAETKERYHRFLAGKLGLQPPTREEEIQNPDRATRFYRQCYTWLRENTRDIEKFKVLFNELINYGFRRNLLGLKLFGIGFNFLTIMSAAAIIRFDPEFAELSMSKLIFLGLLAFIHALYFILGVTEKAVLDASKTYARQLTLSCETLIDQAK